MTTIILLSTFCILAYCLSAILVWRYTQGSFGAAKNAENRIFGLIILAAVLHGFSLYQAVLPGNLQAMTLGHGISMAGWISVVIYIATSFFRKVISSGVVILPISLLAFLLSLFLSDQPVVNRQLPAGVGWHIALAIPTYGILCVAFAQAILILIQDRILHSPSQGNVLTKLPAIQTMESNLFWLTLVGFYLMTLNLGFGMITSMENSGSMLQFNHHILLSIIAWICFGSLLMGRKISGWRGQIAAKWTIVAFAILVLAYFGTRFVNDLVLHT